MRKNTNTEESKASESVFGPAELAVAILAFALVVSAALLGNAYL